MRANETEGIGFIPSDDELTLLAKQEFLASALQALGRTLQARQEADPGLVVETGLTALASIRTWLEASTVRMAMQAVHREQMEEWEDELRRTAVHLTKLADILHDDLSMSLRERNGQPPIWLTAKS